MKALQDPLRRWLLPLAVLAVCSAFLLPGLGRSVMSREQELRVALTARAMADGGDWVRPEFLGEPRLRKPPLMYWAVASAYRLANTTCSATVARMPSALAGLVLVGVIYGVAAHGMGRRRAAAAALICGTSFIFIKQARLAETDVLLCLGTSVAALALFCALRRPDTRHWWWIAGWAAALGFLTKGPAALVLPLLAGLAFALTTPHVRARCGIWKPVTALLIFCAIALPWYAVILADSAGLAQVRDEIQRATATSEHAGSPLYYTYTIFHALAPWSLALPMALVWAWRHRHRALTRFALGWLVTSFVVLSLLKSKQIHYALLLVPPASLLIGDWLGSAWAGRANVRRSARRMLAGYAWLALAIGLLFLAASGWPGLPLPAQPILLVGLYATLAGLAALWMRHSPGMRLVLFTCVWLALTWCLSIRILPTLTPERVIQEAVLMSRGSLDRAPNILFCGPRNAIAEFYANRRLEVVTDESRAWAKAQPGDAVIVVNRKRDPAPHLPITPIVQCSGEAMSCAVLIKPLATN